MIIKCLLAATVLLTLALFDSAHASVSYLIQAEQLNNQSGTALPQGSSISNSPLIMLVADTTGGGFNPIVSGSSTTVGSFLNANDKIIGDFNLLSGANGTFEANPGGITLPPGTPLALYWFPTLTENSATINLGQTYGDFTDATGHNGSAPWVAPADGTNNDPLNFFTSAATNLNNGGFFPASAGNASNTVGVVPEPSRSCLALFALSFALFRRRR